MFRFLGFRDSEEARLKADPRLTLGDVTTINLTIMEGGVQVRHIVQPFFSMEGVSVERCSDSL